MGDGSQARRQAGPVPAELSVREATAADNDLLVRLELECPLALASGEETFDRGPDFFACHRQKPEWRVVIGEWDGRPVGLMTGVIHRPVVRRKPHTLMYVQQARVRPEFLGRRVAWAMANHLFAWSGRRGAEGPYYLIAPDNERSLAFVARGGGRWPTDISLLSLDTTRAVAGDERPLSAGDLDDVVRLVNATHKDDDFFEPLTSGTLAERLARSALYGLPNLFGAFEGQQLVAVAGLWDRGATTERILVHAGSLETTRSRNAALVDWGWARGCEDAFASLVHNLAARARALGRPTLTVCEPRLGVLPEFRLPATRSAVALFTPTIQPPPLDAARGLLVDLLYI